MEVTASSNLTVARHFLVPSPILSAEYIDNLKWQKLIEMQIVVLLGPLIFYPLHTDNVAIIAIEVSNMCREKIMNRG